MHPASFRNEAPTSRECNAVKHVLACLIKGYLFSEQHFNIINRVATVRENEIFSRSGKSQGILWMVREI